MIPVPRMYLIQTLEELQAFDAQNGDVAVKFGATIDDNPVLVWECDRYGESEGTTWEPQRHSSAIVDALPVWVVSSPGFTVEPEPVPEPVTITTAHEPEPVLARNLFGGRVVYRCDICGDTLMGAYQGQFSNEFIVFRHETPIYTGYAMFRIDYGNGEPGEPKLVKWSE